MSLLATPLLEIHERLGARLVPFAGYRMPVFYGSQLEEHRAVRTHAGLFDVSHMAVCAISGEAATDALERLLPRAVTPLQPGRALYTLVLNEAGGIRDDILLYRRESGFWLICNASNTDKLKAYFAEATAGEDVNFEWLEGYALLALQGPAARSILESCVELPDSARGIPTKRFTFTSNVALAFPQSDTHPATTAAAEFIARTGYTGEDGFELLVTNGQAGCTVFERLIAHGATPAGLGARDTLRLEAALPLYGHELDETTSPVAAGLSTFLTPDKTPAYVGKAAVQQAHAEGTEHQLIGLTLSEKSIPRAGCAVFRTNASLEQGTAASNEAIQVGHVTSGTLSPTLGYPIALAYVASDALDGPFEVDIRGRRIPATRTPLPFYRASKTP